jgi:hypothetical protein
LPVYTAFMQADSRGFALFGIPDGDYDVVAQQSVSGTSGAPNEFLMSEARRISVRGADISGLELITNPMASISGTVTLEPSKLPECQNKRRPAFTETIVDLVRNTKARNDEANFFRFYSNSTLPDKNGSFQIKNLRAGEYSFAPRFFARYWYIQSISIVTTAKPASAKAPPTLSKSDAGKNWLTIKSGDKVSGLSIVLAEGAASVRGQMTVPEGTRVPENLNVFAVPAEREKADDAMRFSTGNVLPDGSFALTNMAPGRYWILAQVTTDPELSLEKLRLPGAGESRVRLRRAAESAKTELELKPCQNLNDYKLPSTLQ